MGCKDGLVVIEDQIQPQTNAGPPIYKGFHWWPTPGLVGLGSDIPSEVASAYSEGMRALAVKAPRAAAVMFRGMLAQLLADRGSASAQGQRTLYDKLAAMSNKGSLHPSLVDWAKHIRIVRNAAAHPDTRVCSI